MTIRLLLSLLLVIGLTAAVAVLAPAQSFDKLSDAERRVLQQRFDKEIWPLLTRQGKDGCVGCHAGGKGGGELRLRGDSAKDFAFLIKQGFFIPDDPGSLLGRIVDPDKKRRMPPGARPGWTEAEIEVLRRFVADLDKKQKK